MGSHKHTRQCLFHAKLHTVEKDCYTLLLHSASIVTAFELQAIPSCIAASHAAGTACVQALHAVLRGRPSLRADAAAADPSAVHAVMSSMAMFARMPFSEAAGAASLQGSMQCCTVFVLFNTAAVDKSDHVCLQSSMPCCIQFTRYTVQQCCF